MLDSEVNEKSMRCLYGGKVVLVLHRKSSLLIQAR